MLNVTEGFVAGCLSQIDDLRDEMVADLSDEAVHHWLEASIHGDDDRSIVAVVADASRSRKFDFFTGWGESFDRSRAFITESERGFRALSSKRAAFAGSARVGRSGVIAALRAFLDGMAVEKAKVPIA